MKPWLAKSLTTFWAAFYLIAFRAMGGLIFSPIIFWLGIWKGSLVVFLLSGVWATVFYVLLLQSDSFEHTMEIANSFFAKHPGKVTKWIRTKFFQGDRLPIAWPWFIVVFVGESPLTGTLLGRLYFHKNEWKQGLFWIWIGSFMDILIGFTPVYGTGVAVVHALFSWLGWG